GTWRSPGDSTPGPGPAAERPAAAGAELPPGSSPRFCASRCTLLLDFYIFNLFPYSVVKDLTTPPLLSLSPTAVVRGRWRNKDYCVTGALNASTSISGTV